jgi:mRNA interferase MazF
MTYRQLEIWWVDLEPTRGAETQKKRPCLVISADLMNRESRTVVVAPLLPNHRSWPFVVNLKPNQANGLDKPRHVNLKQMRAVEVSRISHRQGKLDADYREPIDVALKLVFDLETSR